MGWQPGVPLLLSGGEEDEAGERTTVRPVHVGGGAPMAGQYALAYGGPLGTLYAAAQNDMPRFNGRNYTDFIRKWGPWLQDVAGLHGALSDEVRLRLFESAADDGVRFEIQRQRERGGVVKYQTIFSWFIQKYGGDTESEAVADLKNLRLQYEGKLTNVEFIPFAQQFRLMYERQDTIPLEEAARILLAQVPDQMRQRVLNEQGRRTEGQPRVRLAGMSGISREEVIEFVTQTLIRKGCVAEVTVTTKGEQFIVAVANKAAMEALLACNGRTAETPQGTVGPRITTMEATMNLEEIATFIEKDLRTQDRSSQIAKVSTVWQENAKVRAVERKPATPAVAPVPDATPTAKPSTPTSAQRPVTPTRRETGNNRRNDRIEGNWWSDQPRGGGGRSGGGWYGGYAEQERGRTNGEGGKGGKGGGKGGKGKGNDGKGKGKGGDRSVSRERQGASDQSGRGGTRRRSATPSREQPCHNCGSPLHWRMECPAPSARPGTPTRGGGQAAPTSQNQ